MHLLIDVKLTKVKDKAKKKRRGRWGGGPKLKKKGKASCPNAVYVVEKARACGSQTSFTCPICA